MKILYFAWLKEKTGVSSEDYPLAEDVENVSDLVAVLKIRSEGFAAAFENPDLVRVAVNQDHVDLNHPLCDADEVAFFPPVTGG